MELKAVNIDSDEPCSNALVLEFVKHLSLNT